MPRYPLPDGTYNRIWIDGDRATKDPIRITWDRAGRGRAGTGKPLFSRFESCQLELGTLHEDDFEWWKDKWMEDALHTVIMPHEDPTTTGTAENEPYTFTGVAFDNLTWTREDEWHYNVRAFFSHILI